MKKAADPLPRVLIVDDDAVLARTLAQSFERRGFEARVVHSAPEALALAPGYCPTHAVVDLRMTGPSGLECVKDLHTQDEALKIVVLTGYASITTAVEAVKLGATHYLAKPANIEDILAAFSQTSPRADLPIGERKSTLKNLEWERIHQTLVESDYNVSETARRLGLHRRTLARKLAKKPVS